MTNTLIILDHASRTFPLKRQPITVVDDLSLSIDEGQVLCLVGESGCGKTTTGKMIAGVLAPSSGSIYYRGRDIAQLRGRDRKAYRLAVQMIHQDPYASLNPVHTIFDIIAAPLRHHRITRDETETRQRVRELLELVDMTPSDDFLDKYPHQLSGGQR